jgi:hypothetical protein
MKRIAIAAALLALASPAVAQTSTVPMNPPSVWDMPMNPPSVRSEKPITI